MTFHFNSKLLRTNFSSLLSDNDASAKELLWIHFKIREGNKCDLCDPSRGRIYFLSQLPNYLGLEPVATSNVHVSNVMLKLHVLIDCAVFLAPHTTMWKPQLCPIETLTTKI